MNKTNFVLTAEHNGEKFELSFELPGEMNAKLWEMTQVNFKTLLSQLKQNTDVVEELIAEEEVVDTETKQEVEA